MVATLLALWTWSLTADETFGVEFLADRAQWFLAIPLWVLVLMPTRDIATAFDLRATCLAMIRVSALLLVVYLAVFFLVSGDCLPRLVVLYILAYGSLFILAWRVIAQWSLTHTRFSRRAFVVGTGRLVEAALTLLGDPGLKGWRLLGVVAPEGLHLITRRGPLAGPAFDRVEDLARLTKERNVTDLIVAVDRGEHLEDTWLPVLLKCQEQGVHVVRFAQLYEDVLKRVPVEHVESTWPLTSFFDIAKYRDNSPAAKRLVDVLAGVVLALVGLLLTPFVALLIAFESGRPIFYHQIRLGRGGRPFRMTKFRTMVNDAEPDGEPLWSVVGDPRMTRVGAFLRRTRLDEVPNVLSVLRGEMSMVGPRPERPEFFERLERDIPLYRARLVVAPGLTGWAQIKHHYGDSIEDARMKLGYDLYYVKHQTLSFDVRILLSTIWTILKMQGR